MMLKSGFGLLLLISLSYACTSSSDDREVILTYLSTNGIVALDTLGVFVSIEDEGGELKPTLDSTIELSYTGKYLDGEIFDKTEEGVIAKLKLSRAIPGLRSGLLFFGKNGFGSIYLPADQAFGNNPPFGVRKDAILIYDVVVIDI